MAGQQQQILDTIFNMKRKILRKDDSDADDSDSLFASNKQDLRRKVHYARASDPDFLADPRPYKKRIEHAGYGRYILQRNPPRYDPDGDVVELEDEYDEEDDLLEAVEENPYGAIQLENLLAPLTSAADLPNHPALSVAYTSRHLTDLANEAAALARKEQITIARARTLFVKLQGDSDFAPAALAAMGNAPLQDSWANGMDRRTSRTTLIENPDAEMRETPGNLHDVDMVGAEHGQTNGVERQIKTNGDRHPEVVNGAHATTNGVDGEQADKSHEAELMGQSPMADDASETASQQTAHRMTTRARAQAASTPSPPGSPTSDVNAIHPLFVFSTDSLPDRDLGIPASEAEETRMLLMAYVQKQEEVARVTSDLHHGLLQADRMRQEVFKWSKAEAHLGEMSDGEDWYDPEEWNLDHELAKGREEEDDDTAVAGKKSTRQRRKPDKEDR
ncbi:hypothetical protein ACN47E_010033 [Coniothyrium glycines]